MPERTVSRLEVIEMMTKIRQLAELEFIFKEFGDAAYVKRTYKNDIHTIYEQPLDDRPEKIGDVDAIIEALETT